MADEPFIYTTFNAETGLRTGRRETFSPLMTKSIGAAEIVVEGDWGDEYMAPEGEPVLRPTVLAETSFEVAADDVAAIEFALPPDTLLAISRGGKGVANVRSDEDGLVRFSTNIPGTYRIDVYPPAPWLPATLTVIAHAVD